MRVSNVWAFPTASDLSPRRLVLCANLLKSRGVEADELRRYVLGNDLQPGVYHGLFDDAKIAKLRIGDQEFSKALIELLDEGQFNAWTQIKGTRPLVNLIHGPFGTGKTRFIVTLLSIAWKLGIRRSCCAASNAATDHLATVVEEAEPSKGAIRFHSLNLEVGAIRHEEVGVATQLLNSDTSGF